MSLPIWKIIARSGSYHGVTLASASLTGLPHVHQGFGLPLQDVLHADCPHYYRHAFPDETEDQFATRLAEDLEHLILREDPATVAAFIAEPVMGAGGVIIPPATYFEKVQRVLKAYDVLLIADEVITGFGRTGKMFGCETFRIEPDLITVAKALSGGYQPIGAVLIAAPIYQAMQQQSEQIGTFGHGFTCGGHPVSTAVALRALEIYREDDVLAHVGRVAPHFAARLQNLADHPLVGEARSVGLVGALELMANPGQKRPFAAELRVGARVVARALELGVILRPIGDTISFCPPLIIEADEIDLLFDVVHQALDDVAADLAAEVRGEVA